jgi:hypothetical protein
MFAEALSLQDKGPLEAEQGPNYQPLSLRERPNYQPLSLRERGRGEGI